MRTWVRCAVLGAALAAMTTFACAQTPDASAAGDPAVAKHVHPEVTGVSLDTIDSDKAVLNVGLNVMADRDLDLDSIKVTRLRLNGMPVFASPLLGPIHLVAKTVWVAPKPLQITIYLRDLTSIEPLATAVNNGVLTVDGEVFAQIKLGFMARMALMSSNALVPVKLHQEVKLEIPGGSFGKMGAGMLLQGAGLALAQMKGKVDGLAGGLRATVRGAQLPRVVAVTSSYEVQDSSGKASTVVWNGTGFLVDAHHLVVVAEALEPWAFDPELELAVKAKQVKVKPESLQLKGIVASESASPVVLELGKQLSVGTQGSLKSHEVMVPSEKGGMPVKAQIADRAESPNVAVLNVAGDAFAVSSAAEGPVDASSHWDQVAVFRPAHGDDARANETEILLVPAKMQDGRISFGTSVDSDVFGSPIFSADGLIGVVQDEGGGLAWPDAAKTLKLTTTK